MSIFSIGISGLSAAQTALNTTSNNISNVYTPGYNREIAVLENTVGTGGTRVNSVDRQFNRFTANQLNEASSSLTFFDTYEVQVTQIDNLLADQDAGLSSLMQDFFAAVSDLSSTPSDPASRQGVVGAANTLTSQFQSVDAYLEDMHRGINTQIDAEVDLVNNTAELLAKLNKEISVSRAKTGDEPNALLNQRDQLVAELSQSLNVRVFVQDGDAYSVTIGNGQPLVSGQQSFKLSAINSSADPTRRVIGYQDAAANTLELAEDSIDAGKLGGLMKFRSETLDATRDRIGHLAASLASEFNSQHAEGVDINGLPGLDFFSIGEPTVLRDERNSGAAFFVDAAYGNTRELTGVSYDLRVADTAPPAPDVALFTVTRSDGQGSFTAALDGANQMTIDGVVLTLDDPADLVVGDHFALQPTRSVAANFGTEIQDVSLVAAAEAGGATGDNRNALKLQDIQNALIVGPGGSSIPPDTIGTSTIGQGYASIVADVGNRSNITQINKAAQQGITEQIRNLQQSESGVNLDEEAANLVRYQQFYQANARIIDVGTTVIDTLLGLRG